MMNFNSLYNNNSRNKIKFNMNNSKLKIKQIVNLKINKKLKMKGIA